MSVTCMKNKHIFLTIGAVLFFVYAFVGCKQSYSPALADKVDFNYDIRPILVQKCYLCHGPDPSSRKGNLRLDTYEGATALTKNGEKAIDPIHSEKSLLLYRINHKDPEVMMPTPESKLKLTEREIALLKKWIDQGAEWKPYWAFIAPHETEEAKKYSGNPIDYFIEKKLKENDIDPQGQADKNALIRRVSYLLTGLPPTPEAIQKYIADDSKEGYTKIVDHYLQSPQYGERWARHWMDLVRYAETKGHEFDYTISGAWRYRDYLIRAFNDDVPYDQLVREQLAGDLLDNPRINAKTKLNESALGTVFYTMAEGTHSPVDIRKDEADRIDNMIDVTAKTFQALTVSCARCHDHKFDPISTKDYYSFYGIMEGTRFSPIPATNSASIPKAMQLNALNDSIRKHIITTWFKKRDVLSSTTKSIAPIPAKIDTGVIVLGDFTNADLSGWKSDGMAFGNATTLGDPLFNEQGKLAALQEGKASSRKLATGIYGALRSPDFKIDKNFIGVMAAGMNASIRIVIDNFQLISYPIYGNMDQHVDSDNFSKYVFDVTMWKGHKAYVEILPGVFEGHVFKMKKGSYVEAQYAITYNKESTFSKKIPQQPTNLDQSLYALNTNNATISDVRFVNTLIQSNKLERQFSTLSSQLGIRKQLQESFTDSIEFFNGVVDGFGKNSPVFIRGSHMQLSPTAVNRAFIQAVKVSKPDFNVNGSGRVQLANAIIDPNNTLTSRVMVNRIWHHLFGRGIVETVDNFGMQGKLPSHPELLDYLAITFQRDRYSIKKMIRDIMLSNAFKRSAIAEDKAKETDPSNIFLAHYPVRRLEAEAIRDAMLAASGELKQAMYGKPVPVHITSFMNGRGKPDTSGPIDGDKRRSIYIEVRRNFLDPVMSTFDRPNPATAYGRRTVTNVPAQSLILLNDPFVIQEATVMAKNLLSIKQNQLSDRVNWVYQRSLARNASEEEIADAQQYMKQLKNTYVSQRVKGNLEMLVWKDYIHSIFNLKEFIYLN